MPGYDETDSLLSTEEASPPPTYSSITPSAPRQKKRQSWDVCLLVLVALFFFIATICGSSILVKVSRPSDILDPVAREELRREWLAERETHKREHEQWQLERVQHAGREKRWELERREYALEVIGRERERREWEDNAARQKIEWEDKVEHERQQWETEVAHKQRTWQAEVARQRREWEDETAHKKKQWQAEKARHDEEDRRWEQERWERMRLYWGDLWRNPRCHSYAKREYSARLWNIAPGADGIQACQRTLITINGRALPSPTSCEDRVRARLSLVFGRSVLTTCYP